MRQSCLFYVTFTLFIVSSLSNAANLVPDTCMKISKSDPKVEYNFCVTAFGSDPRSSTATLDLLGEISFELGITKAKSISSTILGLLKDPKFDPFAKKALQDCSELYSDASDDLESGLKAVQAKDYSTGNIQGSAAISSGDTCEDGFKDKQGEVSPLTKENSDFFELVAISLALTNMLK